MAYNPTTGVISDPVSIYDVQKCFGLASGDLATLITTANINMWSDIKPIYSPKIVPLTDADYESPRDLTASYFKNGSGIKKRYYGFYQGSDTEWYQKNMGSYGNPASQVWELDRPVVDGVCGLRLTDFAGYWHKVTNVFRIFSYIDNLSNIPIPSRTGQTGVNIDTVIYTSVMSGCIMADNLFGDCKTFYPAIILTCGNFKNSSTRYHYVKTTDDQHTLQYYLSQSQSLHDINATIRINTAAFADAIARDMGGGDAQFANAPLTDGTKWTFCVALVSRYFSGDTSDLGHIFNSNDKIIRLEYAANVDRWVYPIKQDKYTTIKSAYALITLVRQTDQSGHMVYKIGNIRFYADKIATSGNIGFTVTAELQCQIGTVSIPNGGSATNPAHLDANLGSASFAAAQGVQSYLLTTNIYYEITATTAGNQLCNGSITLYNANIGTFTGNFSVNVYAGSQMYEDVRIDLL